MTEERDKSLAKYGEYLRNMRIILQAIADGEIKQEDIGRVKGRISTKLIASVLKEAVDFGHVNVKNYENLEPKIPLSSKEEQFIKQVYEGNDNAEIRRETGWFLDEVYKWRKHVLSNFGFECDQQLVIWEHLRQRR